MRSQIFEKWLTQRITACVSWRLEVVGLDWSLRMKISEKGIGGAHRLLFVSFVSFLMIGSRVRLSTL